MSSSTEIKKKFETVFDKEQATVLTEVIMDSYRELVKTSDFNELKEIVRDIGIKVGALTDAQKKTEIKVEELAEAQKRTEIKVEELAEAQKESQREISRLDKSLQELAEAQKRTEISINKLVGRVEAIEERLEGISNSVGYSLEDKAFKALPPILEKEGVKVTGRIIRRYYRIGDKDNQINIFARAVKNGQEILILGEAKVRPSKKEIDRFLKITESVKKAEKNPEIYLLFVANDYHPHTEQYLQEKGIRYFWSYELD